MAAEWVMRGTNSGPMMGLPATGKAIVLVGADFIRVSADRIASVRGYFDAKAIADQLGLGA